MNTPFFGTETNFINHEIRAWGEEYVEGLLNSGYVVTLTTAGWKWVQPLNTKNHETAVSTKIQPNNT